MKKRRKKVLAVIRAAVEMIFLSLFFIVAAGICFAWLYRTDAEFREDVTGEFRQAWRAAFG